MEMIKLGVMAAALVAVVGCSDLGSDGTGVAQNTAGSSQATTSRDAAPQKTPASPAAEYKPYMCDQGGEHNC
jgi:hypothetical protein